MEELKVHIWNVILFEFKNYKNVKETAKKICGQVCITEHRVWNWFSKFHSDNTSLRSKLRSRCSSNLNQDALRELVECNLHKNTWELAPDCNISQSTICHHLKKDRKSEQGGAFGLSQVMKIRYFMTMFNEGSSELMEMNLHSLLPKTELHGRKVMLYVWWDHHGIIHYEFLNHNQTLNADLSSQQL